MKNMEYDKILQYKCCVREKKTRKMIYQFGILVL